MKEEFVNGWLSFLWIKMTHFVLSWVWRFGEASTTATSTEASTETYKNEHAWNEDPFEDEDNECSHHWLIWTVVLIFNIGCIHIPIIGPAGPGSKDNDRSPYEDHKISDAHQTRTKLEDTKNAAFTAAYLSVPFSTPLICLRQDEDEVGDQKDDSGNIEIVCSSIWARINFFGNWDNRIFRQRWCLWRYIVWIW